MDFSNYFAHSDAVSLTLFGVLVLMSFLTWSIFLYRLLGKARQQQNQFSNTLQEAVRAQHAKLMHADLATRRQILEQVLVQHIARVRFSLEQGLPVLGTIAAIAPFVGLFGTVWGIFHALHAIGQTGQAGLGQVAGPVGEALIMTALGLAVAIPAVLAYNMGQRANRKILHHLQDQAHSVLIQELTQVEPSLFVKN